LDNFDFVSIKIVYTDTWGGSEAPTDAQGKYLVVIGQTYYIRVLGITEFNVGDQLIVKIGWTDTGGVAQTTFFSNVPAEQSYSFNTLIIV